jgi:hypothetical protein
MSRFYERYGFLILWLLTTVTGVALVYSIIVGLAMREALPSGNALVRDFNQIVVDYLKLLVGLVREHVAWIGGLVTLGTFVTGLVAGIRQARRQLPRRLIEFMEAQLTPVYDNSEALVSAVAYRSANVAHKAPLFVKAGLDRALDGLAGPHRPRRVGSLDETIEEADKYIEVTEKRLKYLKDIRSHAQILRGAMQSFECMMRPCSQTESTKAQRCAEADFGEAIENDTTKLAALELRGLLRTRLGSNMPGALQDFATLHAQANQVFCTRGAARALRLQSEILFQQGGGTRLRQARRNLNSGDKLFVADGRALGDEDWLERGRNREICGQVLAAIAEIAGSSQQPAMQAFNDAVTYYERSKLSTSEDVSRVQRKRKESEDRSPPTNPT